MALTDFTAIALGPGRCSALPGVTQPTPRTRTRTRSQRSAPATSSFSPLLPTLHTLAMVTRRFYVTVTFKPQNKMCLIFT